MRRPTATLTLPDGRSTDLHPGQILGRASSAAARVHDPRVSEAHALLSLRGRRLVLIALRGLVHGPSGAVAELALQPGMRVRLVDGVEIVVAAVHIPEETPALVGEEIGVQELEAAVYAIFEEEGLRVVPGFAPSAAAHLWQEDERWWFRRGEEPPRALEPGEAVPVGRGTTRLTTISLSRVGAHPTSREGRIDPPMRVVLRHETATLHREGLPPLVLTGLPARLLSELAAFGAPTPWEWVARGVWGKGVDPESLRRRWDRNLHALRAQLRQGGVLRELVLADGRGNVELVLAAGDELVDEG